MRNGSPSALVTDQGQRVLFRIQDRFFELPQEELRAILGLPPGPAGLGVTIDQDRFCFEFAADNESREIPVKQLYRRLARRATAKT